MITIIEQMKIYINLLGQKQVIMISINRTGNKTNMPPTIFSFYQILLKEKSVEVTQAQVVSPNTIAKTIPQAYQMTIYPAQNAAIKQIPEMNIPKKNK